MADVRQLKVPDGTVYDLRDSRNDPLIDETYTGYYATANTDAQKYFFFLKVTRNDYNTMWRIRMKIEFTIPNYPSYAYSCWDVDIFGFQNATKAYYIKNNLGAAAACRYIAYAYPKTTDANDIYIGGNVYNAANYNQSGYARTVHVTVYEADNCQVTALENITKLADGVVNTTNFTLSTTDLNSTGLQETGDANTTYSIFNTIGHGNGSFVAHSDIYRYQLLFHVDEDKLTPLNNVSNSTGTTKTILTNVEFDPFGDIFYYTSTTTYATNAAVPATYLSFANSGIDLRYSLNISGSVNPLTSNKDVYLKVSPQASGKVKLASAAPLTQTLPSEEDGYWYIFLGRAYSTYQMSLYPHHPVYYHNGIFLVQKLPDETENGKIWYGVCDTAGDTQEKTVSIPGITAYQEGMNVRIRFTGGQAYSGCPSLNINNLGAVAIKQHWDENASRYEWGAGEIVDFCYSNERWLIVRGTHASTGIYGTVRLTDSPTNTSTTLAPTANALATTYALADGKQDALTFDTTPTSGSTNPVTSGGILSAINAKKIWYASCNTSASTQIKNISLTDITSYSTGMYLRVLFKQDQSYAGLVKLQINSLGAKTVYIRSPEAADSGQTMNGAEWKAGTVIDFVYDGVAFIAVNRAHASTDSFGMVKLSSSIDNTSGTQVATASQLKTVYDYAQNRIQYSESTAPASPTTGMVWLKKPSINLEETRCLVVTASSVSTLPTTISDSRITSDMVVISQSFSNPSAQAEDLTWSTAAGSLTLSGSISGTTNITLYLLHSR